MITSRRSTLLLGLCAGAALATKRASANIAMPAVIPQPEHSLLAPARAEMLAFLRQQLIMSVTDRRIYEVLIRINEALLTNHDVVDPRLRMRKPVEHLGGREFRAGTRWIQGIAKIFDDPTNPEPYERDIRESAEFAAAEFVQWQAQIEKNAPGRGLRMRWHIPIKGDCTIDLASGMPVYKLLTSYSIAPIGPWDA